LSDLLLKCSICHALLDEEDLFCANCGTEAAHLSGRPAAQATQLATHNFQCQGCGASMSYDASAQTLRCPFCGSEKLEEQQDAKVLRPHWVVPFSVAQGDALTHLHTWMRSSFWRPGDLAQASRIEKLTKIYVPYWVFAARVYTYWTADSSQVPWGARGDWVPLAGENRASYSGLLVGASSVLAPAETQAICPFDLAQAVPPEQVDLENVVYEQFRVQRKYARPLAQAGLEEHERQACRKYVPGNVRNLKVNLLSEGLTGQPVLLPVWIMAYRYKDRVYRFLVNGQTGACTGTAPVSYHKIVGVVGIVIAIILAVLLGAWLIAAVSGR
jgi:RNA polymerase subunit RPABC4/transcription elongation factor Spt4